MQDRARPTVQETPRRFFRHGVSQQTQGYAVTEEHTMKVLQTLGRHGGTQEGVFQYKRSAAGVVIDSTIGQAHLDTPKITITATEWNRILQAIETAPQGTFRLTGTPPFNEPPNQSLYELLSQSLPNPTNGWTWNDSWKAYICAILEHEGSIDLYHGVLGQHHSAIIPLARDIP